METYSHVWGDKKGCTLTARVRVAPRCRHASERRSANSNRSAEDPNCKKDARSLIQSYVTSSNERQREIKEEWYVVDHASHMQLARTNKAYLSKDENYQGGHLKSQHKKHRIRYLEILKKTRMLANVKTYDWTGDPEDHLIFFQAAAKIERWEIPAVCHMFNSALIGSARVKFDKLPPESIDNYEMLPKAFLGNFSQQNKYIKDPVEIHHIKQKEGESTEAFMEMFKAESIHVNGEPECMRISGFMHDITNPDLIKKLNDNIPKSVDEMMNVTTSFLRGEVAATNRSRKKVQPTKQTKNQASTSNWILKASIKWEGGKRIETRISSVNFTMIKVRVRTNASIGGGFNGDISLTLGKISLMVSLGEEEHSTSASMNFMVVRSASPYNDIIGRLECRMVEGEPNRPTPQELTATKGIKVAIHPEYPEQTVTIGKSLSEKGRMELCNLFKDNLDKFAWKLADMTGVPRSIAKHRLNIRNGCQLIRQKRRGHAPDRNKAIQEEVAKLVQAKIMRKVHYHDWLSNPVMDNINTRLEVSNKSRINKQFSQNNQAMKLTCQRFKVQGPNTSTHQRIPPNTDGEGGRGKDGFSTNQGVFCYTKMSFGLKNVGVTYQRLVDKAFEKQIGRNLDVLRTSSRGQVFADFIAERPDEKGPPMEAPAEKVTPEPWTLFTDGSSCLKGSGDGLILTSLEGEEFTYALRFEFDASNNEAEYESLVAGLWIAEQMGLNIKQRFASVKHPQTSGQVERVNHILGEGIKARLGEDNKNWIEEVSHVLWAHRTMIKMSNGDTLFSLTYNTKAVIPIQIEMPSLRCAKINQTENDEGLPLNLDILEERKEKAAVREAKRKAKLENYYNAKVRNTAFRPGDFIYRNNEASHAKESEKLSPKWEGPYEVVEALWKGVYKLMNESGDILPST
nr:reverse transcriptase domain-containing protein [Tanacetum cinerariifolium]